MKNKKQEIKDVKYYKRKLDTNVGGLLAFFVMCWVVIKISDLDLENGIEILMVILGIVFFWFLCMSLFEIIIKFLTFGRKLK